MKKKISLKDIAQKIGVSTALVSYVLNDKEKESRVGKEMAAKIRKTAKELNYQPNQIARSLKSGKTNTIGLILADIANPFFSQIARVIEDEAKKNNYTVIFGSSDENLEKSKDLINVLLNRQVDGFIIAPSEGSEDQIKYLKKYNIPFVLIDRYFPGIETNHIAIDNYKASYEAVNHLINTGHKRIGMIAYKTKLFHMQERMRGYLDAMGDNNLLVDTKWLKEAKHDILKEDVENIVDELVTSENGVDALFFATNTLAIHGLKHIDRRGLKVPENIGIICFDQGDAFDFYYCPLTYINQPIAELGRGAIQLLLRDIAEKPEEVKKVCLEAKLVIRESCGAKDGAII
jgi:LacI family transcriptional regulator